MQKEERKEQRKDIVQEAPYYHHWKQSSLHNSSQDERPDHQKRNAIVVREHSQIDYPWHPYENAWSI
jgi:hypothetical protein